VEALTPAGLAGIAVLRVAPTERAAVVAALRRPGGGPFTAFDRWPRRATLHHDGRDLDDVLVVERDGILELHVHGSPAVLDALDARFGVAPASPCSPAAALLRDALADAQLELALEQLGHDFAACIAALAQRPPAARAEEVAAALARSRVAMALATPRRLVLAGRQNAGKSSLFNRLLARERAITGAQPGLTRDAVSECTALAGYPYELVDTAGEGPSSARIDATAIERARALRHDALVVWLVDASAGPDERDREVAARCDLVVASKVDLARAPWPRHWRCDAELSAARDGTAELRAAFGELLRRRRDLPPAGRVGGFAATSAAQLAALAALRG
jgi:small GTP-binding protein